MPNVLMEGFAGADLRQKREIRCARGGDEEVGGPGQRRAQRGGGLTVDGGAGGQVEQDALEDPLLQGAGWREDEHALPYREVAQRDGLGWEECRLAAVALGKQRLMGPSLGLRRRLPAPSQVEHSGKTQVGRRQDRLTDTGCCGGRVHRVGLRRIVQDLPFDLRPEYLEKLRDGHRTDCAGRKTEAVVEPVGVSLVRQQEDSRPGGIAVGESL
jgi:hypothetical protein